ncbi:MAG: hypothetical protein KDE31_15790, partial [Caldilineaceae bacterium]|nr:hypothetical protein [Caldilineaceae bacterium]
MQQEVGEAEVARLHLRASFWFEQNGFITEALHHALAAADLDRAVAVAAAHGLAMIRRGAIATVQEWLKALPPERVRAHPKLCIHLGWVLFHTYQSDEIESVVQAAERALEKPAFANAPDRAQLFEHIMALRISVAEIRQENATVVQLAQQALARVADDNPSARGTNLYFLGRALGNLGETNRGIEACLASVPCYREAGVILAAMGALSDAALFLLQQGKLRSAQQTVEDALHWAAEEKLLSLPATAQLLMVSGQIHYERNELRAALAQLQQSTALAKYMLPLTAALAHLGVAQVQLAMGDPAGALAALQEAEQLATYRTLVPPEATFLTTHRVRIWLRQGDFAAATRWIQLSGLQVDHEPAYCNEQELIALARILVWRSQTNKQALDL